MFERARFGIGSLTDVDVATTMAPPPRAFIDGTASRAIRIALSKLLARRAGAKLQTLVIDEGFGSQDARGLGLVVETINSIKDDFQLIIVISHIEELKDQFGARIDVLKEITGSRVSVA